MGSPRDCPVAVLLSIAGGEAVMPACETAQWFGPGSRVVIQGYTISDALLYVGERLPSLAGDVDDHCLVQPSLPIQCTDPDAVEPILSSIHYKCISPECRDAYLRWLSAGRSWTMPVIGYVLLFVYGLERRLFVDGPKGLVSSAERRVIIDEVLRLQAVYGQHASFLNTTDNLIAMEWLLYRRNSSPPACFTLADRYSIDVVQIKLAYYIARGKAVHAWFAYQILMLVGGSDLRVPSRRCPEHFREMFLLRFSGKYADGIVLRRYKTVRNLKYHAANPSLHDVLEFRVEGLSFPLYRHDLTHKLTALALICSWELYEYSRYIAQGNPNVHGLLATGLLPSELMQRTKGWKTLKSLITRRSTDSPACFKLDELYACFDQRPPSMLRRRECVVMAMMLESMGFSMVPDVRIHAMQPDHESRIAVLPFLLDAKRTASGAFGMIVLTIQLAGVLCRTDGTTGHAGEKYLMDLIDGIAALTSREKASLHAFLLWSLHTPQSSVGMKRRLSYLGAAEKTAISHILISVAYADGRIDSREIRQLEKLYATLGLDKEHVMRDLHTLAADGGPVTVRRRESEASFAIPAPPDSEPASSAGFQLKQELIRIREEETRRVKGVLDEIFADESEPQSDMYAMSQEHIDSVDPLLALDEQHRCLLRKLLEKERWERVHVDELCIRLGLMADGAMETLNEWAYTQANAPLLETGDHVFIDLDLAREIQDVR